MRSSSRSISFVLQRVLLSRIAPALHLLVKKPRVPRAAAAVPPSATPGPAPAVPAPLRTSGLVLPFEVLARILDLGSFTLEELLPIRLVSHRWRAAAHAQSTYSRDIDYGPVREYAQGRAGWDDVAVKIPLDLLTSRLTCTTHPTRLSISTLTVFDPDVAQPIFALIGEQMHRLEQLHGVFNVEHLPLLWSALRKPAPILRSFSLKVRQIIRSTAGTTDDYYTRVVGVLITLPPDVFAGHAPHLEWLSLYDVALDRNPSVMYPALANVRTLVLSTGRDCVSPARMLSVCPLAEALQLVDPRYSAHCWAGDFSLDNNAEFTHARRLRTLALSCGNPHISVLTHVAHRDMPNLCIASPSEETTRLMFSHLEGKGPLVFSVAREPSNRRFFWSVNQLRGRRSRTIEIPEELTSSYPRVDFLTSCLPSAVAACITRLCVRASHIELMAGITGSWDAVELVKLDISISTSTSDDDNDAQAVLHCTVPALRCRFPALSLLMISWPDGPAPSAVEDWANWVTAAFFGPNPKATKRTAYATSVGFANLIMQDLAVAHEYTTHYHLWSNTDSKRPWGEYERVAEYLIRRLELQGDLSTPRKRKRVGAQLRKAYIDAPRSVVICNHDISRR
ncbi:hypothetical protein EXIGLDRAFT_844776 [Exidia glandulosa HHB12029]|uniref:F-box domain-containing protein n=1 Tax=Exidia glandulosa HHB12029 TaxID=1314781 RepID=A0A165ZBJ7_EXIGL|nr:hypothetical protein EXIGLDRAFT_844776 [Exidia glandulosa HHB12029]